MSDVIFRDVEAGDIPRIKKVIGEVWDWVSVIEDEEILDATIGLYLNQILYEGTFVTWTGRNQGTGCCWRTEPPTPLPCLVRPI